VLLLSYIRSFLWCSRRTQGCRRNVKSEVNTPSAQLCIPCYQTRRLVPDNSHTVPIPCNKMMFRTCPTGLLPYCYVKLTALYVPCSCVHNPETPNSAAGLARRTPLDFTKEIIVAKINRRRRARSSIELRLPTSKIPEEPYFLMCLLKLYSWKFW
jgi:hypothetical protein